MSVTRQDLEAIMADLPPALLARMGKPDDMGITFRVDGDDVTQLVFWAGLDRIEQRDVAALPVAR